MSAVKILDWKPRLSGALRGFADVEFPSGAIFHECGVFEQNGRWWASPAAKPQVSREGTVLRDDRGKTKYIPVVSFRDKARRDLWSSAVVTAVHAVHPEVLA